MDISLYKQLVGAAVSSYKGYTDDIKTTVMQYTSTLSGFQVMEFDQGNVISSNWAQGLACTEWNLNKNNPVDEPVAFLELHDGSFVVVFNNAPTRHYTTAGELIGVIPFKFATPASGVDAKNYLNPASGAVVHFSTIVGNTDTPASLLLIPVTGSHVVQAYIFRDGLWSFGFTLGTIGVAGNGAGTALSSPVSVAGEWVTRSANVKKFRVIVSCEGQPSAGGVSATFLKEIIIDAAGSLEVGREISWASQYLVAGGGSLVNSETLYPRSLGLKEGLLSLVNNGQEVGVLKLSANITTFPNQTIVMKTNPIGALPYLDTAGNLTAVAGTEIGLVVADNKGHVFLFDPSLTEFRGVIGKDRANAVTKYPFEFGAVSCLAIRGSGELIICAGDRIYRTNLLSMAEQEIVFAKIVPMDCRLEKFAGFNKGTVEFSVDSGASFHPIEFFELKTVPAGTVIQVRVRLSVEEAKENKDTINSGLLIVSV